MLDVTVARGYTGYEHSTGKPVQVAAIGVERSAGLTHDEAPKKPTGEKTR